MSLAEDLRTWLIADPAIAAIVGDRVHENSVPQDTGQAYIFYARSTSDRSQDSDLSSPSVEPYRVNFDIECISDDIDEAAELAAAVSAKEHFKGPFGNGTVQGVFITSHAGDYQPRGLQSDEGWHLFTLDLQVAGYVAGT